MINTLYNILYDHIQINNFQWHDLANIDENAGFSGVITNDTMISWSYILEINGNKIKGECKEFATDIYPDSEFLMNDVVNDHLEETCKHFTLEFIVL